MAVAWEIRQGDCLEVLQRLESDSVDCCVTSPPYWGLRDYGVDGQLGLEHHPSLYLECLWAVFDEVRRVLKNTGCAFVVLGDTYGRDGAKGNNSGYGKTADWVGAGLDMMHRVVDLAGYNRPKQLLLIPARFAIGCQERGWLVRSDIIWEKPNCLPESATDRYTKSYEHVFMLVKQERYFFNMEAVLESYSEGTIKRVTQPNIMEQPGGEKQDVLRGNPDSGNGSRCNLMAQAIAKKVGQGSTNGRHPRDVWTIPTAASSIPHFATYPPALVRRCIRAGCPPKVCADCGKPWVREVERDTTGPNGPKYDPALPSGGAYQSDKTTLRGTTTRTPGPWHPACSCNADWQPGLVIDPFVGSGTTGLVAVEEGHRFLGFDLSKDYCTIARARCAAAEAQVTAAPLRLPVEA